MGDRGQIAISQGDGTCVYLYSHWDGSRLPEILKSALIRGKNRWGDSCYLARIIFCEMVKGREMEETGFGIDTAVHDDVYQPIPTLDCGTQMIVWNSFSTTTPPISFADFIIT